MLQILQDTDYVHKSGSPEERRPLSLIRAMHFPRINRWIPGRSSIIQELPDKVKEALEVHHGRKREKKE